MKNLFLSIICIYFLQNTHQSVAQEIWGMTRYGGKHQKGVIFKMDENASNQEVVFSFEAAGLPEGRMTEYSEGVFYGMTSGGGKYDNGVIYSFNALNGGFIKILDFDGEASGKDGRGSMLLTSNGKFYGMTVNGGTHDMGILFEFDPVSAVFTKKIDFNGSEKGSEPLGSLIQASDGILYGMTSMGGIHEAGVLFSFNPDTDSFDKKVDFDGEKMGSNPMGSLTEASDRTLYGMTRWGGANDHGVIFSFIPQKKIINTIFEFDGPETGRNPHGSLIESDNGKLYGMTPFGGSYNLGVIFEFDPNVDQYKKKEEYFEFGSNFYGSLSKGVNGNLYGIVNEPLDSNYLFFEYNPEQEIIQAINYYAEGLRNYTGFMESLIIGKSGKIYFWGTDVFYIERDIFLFQYDPDLKSITEYYKNNSFTTGSYPCGSLIQAKNGNIYSLTSRGGKFDKGVLFEFNPDLNVYRTLIDFDGVLKGSTPNGSLLEADNHKLYGMSSDGGTRGKGVIFEFDPISELYFKLVDFDGADKGEFPMGNLIQADNGKLYGMTTFGGIQNNGVLFEFDLNTGSYIKLIEFNGKEKGSHPLGSLIQGSDSNIYGVTGFGGEYDKGVLFKYVPSSGIYTKLIDCEGWPKELMQATNGKIYLGYSGHIYEFDPEKETYNKIEAAFNRTLSGKLLEISNQKLLGMDSGTIELRGIEDKGLVFEFDLNDYSSSVKLEFNSTNGSNPENSGLIQLRQYTEPLAACKDIVLYLDENGQAVLYPSDIDNGSSGSAIQLSINKSIITCDDIGKNSIVLTVKDEFGNEATCSAEVTLKDTIPPKISCRNIEVVMESSGIAYFEPSDIDNGTIDNCGINAMSLNINSLSCENLKENTVELTVTDNSGNQSTCMATVTVIDKFSPEISCLSELTKYLDPHKEVYIVEDSKLDAEAADNCSIAEVIISGVDGEIKIDSSLADIQLNAGRHEIVWTATDAAGNESSCTSLINIEKRPTTLIIIENEADPVQGVVQLKAKLLDELIGSEIEGKSLNFKIGSNSETAVTDRNGVATVEFAVNEELTVKNYSVTAIFEEDRTYKESSSVADVLTTSDFAELPGVSVFPNPFSDRLHIEFVSPETAKASIELFDPNGRLVKTLFNHPVEAGRFYKAEYTPGFETGSYFLYRIKIGKYIHTGKVIYMQK